MTGLPQKSLVRRGPDDEAVGRLALLSHIPLFNDLQAHPEALVALAAMMEQRSFTAGTPILSEGEDGTEAYFLTAGSVKVLKSFTGNSDLPVALLRADDHAFFGEAGLLQRDTRSASIAAESECTCLTLQKDQFDLWCHRHPIAALPVVRRIACILLERLHRANGDVALLYKALVNEVKGWNG